MPLKSNIQLEDDIVLAIWEITELEAELSSKLKNLAFLNTVKHPLVRKQKIAIRCILNELGLDSNILYTPSGKPYTNSHNIGISHSDKYASIIVSSRKTVAVDIETGFEKSWKLKNRFLHHSEMSIIDTPTKSAIAWAAKECYVKLHDKKHVEFDSLHIKNVSNEKIEILVFDKSKTEHFNYSICENYVLIWGSKSNV